MSRYCLTCGKASKACICRWITPIRNQHPVIILQHPSEVSRAIGTARILSLSLSQCEIFVGEDFSNHDELNAHLSDSSISYQVLFPGEHAKTLSSNSQSTGQQTGLILIDGTWKKAFKIYQLSTNLHQLPSIALDASAPSAYRIRKAPKDDALSTVEAGFYALSALSGNSETFQPLMTAFNRMIDFQIAQMPADVYRRHYKKD